MALLFSEVRTAIAADVASEKIKTLHETMYALVKTTVATAGTLDIEVEWSLDGNTWVSFTTPDDFTQIVAATIKEIQDVDDGDATAGDFKLQVTDSDGVVLGTTGVIVFNETAPNLKILLDAIVGVTVEITGVGSVADPYVITFEEPIENLPLMTIVDDTTTGGTGAGIAANQDGSGESWLAALPARAQFLRFKYVVATGPFTFEISLIGF